MREKLLFITIASIGLKVNSKTLLHHFSFNFPDYGNDTNTSTFASLNANYPNAINGFYHPSNGTTVSINAAISERKLSFREILKFTQKHL
ncbi:hypothetical protein [Flavobacterium pectinovorum]|uniref:hypothetical protein n=1 Tax=Flavobacterium pectinovorum TaxID=29533 RepID=UPI001FAD302E|nr:hypothetical protein [Flavobacterium pectinovorum]MCI9843930.1 hypothetical protein [Flavobacterium pectinovorum]